MTIAETPTIHMPWYKRTWVIAIATGVISSFLASAITFAIGFYNGYEDGLTAGKNQGHAKAYQEASVEAHKLLDKFVNELTPVLTKQLVEQAYEAQLKEAEQKAYTMCSKEARQRDALWQFWDKLKDAINIAASLAQKRKEGGGTENEMRLQARVVAEIARIGREAIGTIQAKVLDGQIDEMAAALNDNNMNELEERLLLLRDTLDVNEISVEQALTNLESAQ